MIKNIVEDITEEKLDKDFYQYILTQLSNTDGTIDLKAIKELIKEENVSSTQALLIYLGIYRHHNLLKKNYSKALKELVIVNECLNEEYDFNINIEDFPNSKTKDEKLDNLTSLEYLINNDKKELLEEIKIMDNKEETINMIILLLEKAKNACQEEKINANSDLSAYCDHEIAIIEDKINSIKEFINEKKEQESPILEDKKEQKVIFFFNLDKDIDENSCYPYQSFIKDKNDLAMESFAVLTEAVYQGNYKYIKKLTKYNINQQRHGSQRLLHDIIADNVNVIIHGFTKSDSDLGYHTMLDKTIQNYLNNKDKLIDCLNSPEKREELFRKSDEIREKIKVNNNKKGHTKTLGTMPTKK